MNAQTFTVELCVKELGPDEVIEIWRRLNLVAEGFLRDGRDVEVQTFRFDDDDDVEVITGPPETGATR